jgi:hypothetical protein
MEQEKLAEKFENALMDLEKDYRDQGLTPDSLVSVYEMRSMALNEENQDDSPND